MALITKSLKKKTLKTNGTTREGGSWSILKESQNVGGYKQTDEVHAPQRKTVVGSE